MFDIQRLIDDENYSEAVLRIDEALYKNPDDLTALFQFGEVLLKSDRIGLAYVIYRQLSKLAPNRYEVWNNLGRCLQSQDRTGEARNYFKKSLTINQDAPGPMINLAVLDLNSGKPESALKLARRALELDPKSRQATDVLSMAKFHLRDWSGWDDYLASEGPPFRTMRGYCIPPESEWMGEPGKTVVIYREQGLGDDILHASCLQECIDRSRLVIVDVDSRLVGLFKRSFPEAVVYGTGYSKELDWPKEYPIDASAPFGRIPMFFRRKDSDFPGTPYLKADPERKRLMRERLDSLGEGLKIGIAWTGGKRKDSVTKADSEYRSYDLRELKSLLHEDHHYVSLEYRNTETYGLVADWRDVTQSNDYDDTAALVDELDFIIAVPTTVVHLAGALGKTCYCLTPEFPNWRFGLKGDMLWHKSVKLFRGKERVNQLRNYLEARHYHPGGTGASVFSERSNSIREDGMSHVSGAV